MSAITIPRPVPRSAETPKEAARRIFDRQLNAGFEPAGLHDYADVEGRELFYKVRLKYPSFAELPEVERDRIKAIHKCDGKGKIILPIHWNDTAYVKGQGEKPPEGWPLYNLAALLAADAATPLFIVEGEQCAEALAGLGLTATTSGASSSAGGADWMPLAGRKCIIWPDHDTAGMDYAAAVVAKLQTMGVTVQLIAPEIIEALPEKGDVVDWLAEHPAATVADVLELPTVEAHYTPQNNRATVQPLPVKPPKIAGAARILDLFREAIRGCGVVGEDAIGATVYLIITSRLLGKPVSLAVKGPSSSGKSYTTEKTVKFFPKEAVIEMTAMSERALVYSKEDFAHRMLILYEATALREGAEDNLTAYFVRSLLSEGRIEYPCTVRDKDGNFTTKTIIKEGPTGLIVTTTKTRVHAENETRLLSLNTNDSREQTKSIFRALASEAESETDLSEWHQLQSWLQTAEHRVTVPYAHRLAELVPPVAVRLRRDFGALLALVRTHAILHQQTRERDGEGRIVATLDDYAQVRELVAPIMAEGVGSTVAETVRETVEAVEVLATDQGVMALAIAERLKLDKSTVSRRLRMAADGGYIRNLEEKRGKPGRWIKGDPLPEETDLLPQPHNLKPAETRAITGGCTVASDFEGVKGGDGQAVEPAEFDL